MSKKHYEYAAEIAQRVDDDARAEVIEAFADLFRQYGSRFDVERFKRACQPGANVWARG